MVDPHERLLLLQGRKARTSNSTTTIGFAALNDSQTRQAFDRQQCLVLLEGID